MFIGGAQASRVHSEHDAHPVAGGDPAAAGPRPALSTPVPAMTAPTVTERGVAAPRRVEFWGDPPAATAVVALAFAVVRDPSGRVLLARRVDTGNWELPGGRIEPGETVTDAVIREVAEETGLAITVTGLAGVFCDPSHVIVYPDRAEARQQHVTLVHAVATDGEDRAPLATDQTEIDATAWVELDDLVTVPIHPSVHRRLDHALRHHRGHTEAHLD